jgi:hypothetical protein
MPTLPTVEQEVLIRFKADPGRLKRGSKQATKALNQTAKAATSAKKSMSDAALAGEQIGRIGQALPGQLSPIAGVVGAITGAFRSSEGRILAFGLAITGVIGAAVKFGPAVADWASNLLKVDDAIGKIIEGFDTVIKKQEDIVAQAARRTAGILPGTGIRRTQEQDIEAERVARAKEAELRFSARILNIAKVATTTEQAQLELRRARRDLDLEKEKIDERAAQQIKFVQDALVEQIALEAELAEQAEKDAAARNAAKTEEIRLQKELNDLAAQFPFGPGGGVGLAAGPGPVGGVTFLAPGGSTGGRRTSRGGASGPGNLDPAAADDFLRTEKLKELTQGMTDVGSATEQVAEHAFSMRDGFLEAFEAIGAGQKSVTEALVDFARQGVAGALRAEAEKQFALGVADAITLNPQAALHFAAAASLSAAAGAIGGDGGGSGGGRGGGSLPGAAAGAFAGTAGGGQTREIVYIGLDEFDDDVRGKRRRGASFIDRVDRDFGNPNIVERS